MAHLIEWVSPISRDVGSIGCYGTELPHCAGAGRHCHLPRLSWVLLPASGRVLHFSFRCNTWLPVDQSVKDQVHIIIVYHIRFPSTRIPGATQGLTFDTPCLFCLKKAWFFLFFKNFSRKSAEPPDQRRLRPVFRVVEGKGEGGRWRWIFMTWQCCLYMSRQNKKKDIRVLECRNGRLGIGDTYCKL